jgi:hypothetical protein
MIRNNLRVEVFFRIYRDESVHGVRIKKSSGIQVRFIFVFQKGKV